MKKIGLICLALVLALGALGVGYAAWTDTVTISGPVTTGRVCLGFTEVYGEIGPALGGDWEYTNWVYTPGAVSCPPNYTFTGIHRVEEGKNVGQVSIERYDNDGDGYFEVIEVTITDAYPYYLAWISTHVINCGTIPVKIYPVVLPIIQDDGILIKWGDSYNAQLEPGVDAELSFYVGFPQHLPNGDLLPQGATLHFTINLAGVQWNEYVAP